MKRMLMVAAAAVLLSASAFAQQGAAPAPGVLRLQSSAQAQVSPAARAQLTQLSASRLNRNVMVAQLAPDALRRAAIGSSVALNVAPNLTLTARAVAVETEASSLIWRGEVLGSQTGVPPGMATLVVSQNGGVTGSVQSPDGRMFRLRPLADGSTAIFELDYNALPADEPADQRGAALANQSDRALSQLVVHLALFATPDH